MRYSRFVYNLKSFVCARYLGLFVLILHFQNWHIINPQTKCKGVPTMQNYAQPTHETQCTLNSFTAQMFAIVADLEGAEITLWAEIMALMVKYITAHTKDKVEQMYALVRTLSPLQVLTYLQAHTCGDLLCICDDHHVQSHSA